MSAVAVPLGGSRLAAFNPAAKLAAAAVVLAGLLVTADLLAASIVLGAELVAIPFAGIRARVLAVRAWPLPVAAAGVAVANLVASSAGPATIAAVSLRLLAIALPGILVFATTEPVDLADSLVQQLRVPPRFAYGSLAALGLLPLLAVDWATIRRARRARHRRRPLAACRGAPVRLGRVRAAGHRDPSRHPARRGDGQPRLRSPPAAHRGPSAAVRRRRRGARRRRGRGRRRGERRRAPRGDVAPAPGVSA